MGVKTELALCDANRLFAGYRFETIEATAHGIVDTTYVARTEESRCIVKKYEEADAARIGEEHRLLRRFARCALTVPRHLASSGEWHLYSCLEGEKVRIVRPVHLQSLGRALARMHRCNRARTCGRRLFDPEAITPKLRRLKEKRYGDYRRLRRLRDYRPRNEGVIHGDLFLDNVLFRGGNIGFIDFIDAGEGGFAFDLGVAALAWALRGSGTGYLRLLLRSYNQLAPTKVSFAELAEEIETAAAFYTLNRIDKDAHAPAHQRELLKKTRLLKRGLPC
jgi:homoserine kinase type II